MSRWAIRMAAAMGVWVVAFAARTQMAWCSPGGGRPDAGPSDAGATFDWPCWRGPERNGISRETGWLAAWPEGAAPRAAWKAAVGKGHSAVVVAGGLAYAMGWDGASETVFCLDAAGGAVRWRQSYACQGRAQFPGPRGTPAVEGGTVYTLGQQGHLNAYDAATGRPRWTIRLPEDYSPDVDYGHCWSPLIVGDLIVLSAGRRGLAIEKRTGRIAWGDDRYRGSCASAVPYEHAGRRGVIITNTDRDRLDVVGVDPADGRELWRFRSWPEKWGAFGSDPIVRNGQVFITSGQEHHACARISFAGGPAAGPGPAVKDWESREFSSNTGQCVYIDGHVYGVNQARKALTCLRWDDGQRVWEHRGFGEFGTLVAADGRLIAMTDGGDLVVAEASPQGHRQLRRAEAVVGKTFTPPTLANGRIYCRDLAGSVVCLAVGGVSAGRSPAR